MILRLILLFTLFVTFSNSKTIIVNDKDSKVSILEHATIYIDDTSELSFNDIQKKDFNKTNTDYIKLGYSHDTLWLKFNIKNNSDKKLERYITITNNMLDTIELYTKQKNSRYKKEVQGLLNHKYFNNNNNLLHSTFKVTFQANEIKEFYYQTHSLSSANYFKLYFKDKISLYKDEFSYQLILALFIGTMIAFIIYNTFIFYFTKEKTYLYYVIYIFFTTWNHISYSSMSAYFIPLEYAYIEAFAALYYITLVSIFSILFIQTILSTKQYKVINLILNLFILLSIILAIMSVYDNTLIGYVSLVIFINMLYLLFVCIYSYLKQNKQARYILIGWSINILGIVMLYLINLGEWNLIDYFPYFYELTVFLEAILFSVALASKLNKNKELEESVSKNVILTRELHHRVKNNMQFIILMYRLKLVNLMDDKIELKLKETEGSIQAMSKTHEILYNQDNLEDIDTKLYFENLIGELQRSFDTGDIRIDLNISTTIDTQQAIYCGIILNELITNAIKYAFTDNQGAIHITLLKEQNNYLFKISDDGIGFNYEEAQADSFGLSFIKAMVEDELKGNIEFIRNSGTTVQIRF